MNWLREDKEIFISKLNYLKNYYEELKSFESLLFLQYIEDKIKRRAIERLLQLIVEKDIASKLARTTGLWNRIIHEYGEYKDEVVYKNISIFIEFYGKYLKILGSKVF